jgi:hypothetical protein
MAAQRAFPSTRLAPDAELERKTGGIIKMLLYFGLKVGSKYIV